ncbi:FtsX-like permease family protein [bacterium]|nr:FtsX-like permease family protein [bacterium]
MMRSGMLGYAWTELTRRKARTGLCIFGYAVAVAAVVAVACVATPRIRTQANLLLTVGTHLIGFVPDPAYQCARGVGPCAQGVYTAMIHDEELQRVREIPGVKAAAPYILFQQQNFASNTTVTIGGLDLGNISTQINVCPPEDVIKGRYIEPTDAAAVMAEESYATATRLGVGDTAEAFGRKFTVIGIVNTNIRAVKANLYAPIAVVKEILAGARCVRPEAGDFNIILVEVADARLMESVRSSLRNQLTNAAVVSFNCYGPARDAVAVTNATAWLIAAVIALFVALLAGNSQWTSVVERRRDIGVLKALGWPSGWVTRQILAESILQAMAGGVLGCAIGLLAVVVVRSTGSSAEWAADPEPLVAVWAALGGMTLALAGGVLAGLFPALRAYRLTPAEALRRL